MKTVEFSRWMTGNLQDTKLAETALACHPEAVRVPGVMELREICTTDEDMRL